MEWQRKIPDEDRFTFFDQEFGAHRARIVLEIFDWSDKTVASIIHDRLKDYQQDFPDSTKFRPIVGEHIKELLNKWTRSKKFTQLVKAIDTQFPDEPDQSGSETIKEEKIRAARLARSKEANKNYSLPWTMDVWRPFADGL